MQNISTTSTGLWALYGAIFLLALNGVFAKAIPLASIDITQTRSVIACAVLCLVALMQRTSLRLESFRQYLGVYALGVLLGLHWVTYFHAMQVASVAVGMLSLFCYPVIVVVLEPLVKRQRPKLSDLGAAVMVFIGILLMLADDLLAGEFGSSAVVGALWGVLSALCFAVRNVGQKYFFPSVKSVPLMAHQTLAIGVLLIPFINFSEISSLSAKGWMLIVALGCFCTALAHTFMSLSLKHLPAKSVALIGCLLPVVGGFIAWVVLGEIPNVMVYVGGAVILSVAAYESVTQNK